MSEVSYPDSDEPSGGLICPSLGIDSEAGDTEGGTMEGGTVEGGTVLWAGEEARKPGVWSLDRSLNCLGGAGPTEFPLRKFTCLY